MRMVTRRIRSPIKKDSRLSRAHCCCLLVSQDEPYLTQQQRVATTNQRGVCLHKILAWKPLEIRAVFRQKKVVITGNSNGGGGLEITPEISTDWPEKKFVGGG